MEFIEWVGENNVKDQFSRGQSSKTQCIIVYKREEIKKP